MDKHTVRPNRTIRAILALLIINLFLVAQLSHAKTQTPSSPLPAASLVQTDTTTQGNWSGVYGHDGYSIDRFGQSIPSYARLAVDYESSMIWAATTTDPRALQTSTSRIAAAWYKSSSFTFNVNFTDGATHEFAMYMVDWDNKGRAESVQIFDSNTNALLNTQSVSNFSQGLYLVFNISGHVRINVTATSGPSAVVSGVLFAPAVTAVAPPPPPPPPPPATYVLTSSASALSFGNVTVSQSATQVATLTNAGTGSITISNVLISGAGFSLSGLPVGTVLAPGQSAAITATFAPASTGTLTGSIVVSSNATAGANSFLLSGTGLAQQYSVDLSWNASSSTNIVGYNTYYSTVSGGPYAKLNASPVSSTAYTDSTVTAGMVRYYVVTSVNSSSEESGYSTEVGVTVP